MRPPRFSFEPTPNNSNTAPANAKAGERQKPSRDHVERAPDKLLASVTDRGKAYPVNQDDARVRKTALDAARVTIMVVCDGVSSGQCAESASEVAVTAATDFLFSHISLGGDPREAMRQAIMAADSAIRGLDYTKRRTPPPPGSTIVAAVAIRKRLIVGWIGDSRCYLIDKTGAQLLTHDHSWVNSMVDSGSMTEEQALGSREAHQISRCLGPLYGNRTTDIPEPATAVYQLPDGPAMVVLCTDGFWNYVTSLQQMAGLVSVGPGAPDAISQARRLVNFALSEGGKDNISVAVMIK